MHALHPNSKVNICYLHKSRSCSIDTTGSYGSRSLCFQATMSSIVKISLVVLATTTNDEKDSMQA